MLKNEETKCEHEKTMESDQYSCGHCQVYLTSLQDLKEHFNSFHNKESKSTDSKSKSNSKAKSKKCNLCNKDVRPYYLPIHMKSVHEKRKDIECDKCDQMFSRRHYLNKHKMHIHEGIKRKKQPKVYVECDQCNKKLQKQCLANHIKIAHSEIKNFECDFCDKTFPARYYLERHHKSMHQDEDSVKVFECSKCNLKFKQKPNLKTHEKIHDKPKELAECSTCLKKFSSLKRLALHELTHDEKFKCEYCEERFSRDLILKKHIQNVHLKTHVKESVQCEICSKIYSDKYSYSQHYNQMHKGANYVKCNICLQTYSNVRCLLEHVDRMHTNVESKFKCDACDKFFKTECDVKIHRKRVHLKINKFKCKICGKSFFTKKELIDHSKINHKGQREVFECNYCKKNFVTKWNRNVHIRRLHEKL